MEAPATLEIAFINDLRLGDTTLQGGDLFDAARHLSRGAVDERLLGILRNQARIKPLTKENYAIWRARNGPAWVGRGFTEAELRERGIIDPDADAAAAKAAAEAKAAEPKERAAREPKGDPIEYEGCLIQAYQVGRFTNYDVADKDCELLRAKPFKSLDYAKKFIDELKTSTPKAPTGKPAETQQESGHDRDVQSGTR